MDDSGSRPATSGSAAEAIARAFDLEAMEKTIRTLAAGAQLKLSSILSNNALTLLTFTAE